MSGGTINYPENDERHPYFCIFIGRAFGHYTTVHFQDYGDTDFIVKIKTKIKKFTKAKGGYKEPLLRRSS